MTTAKDKDQMKLVCEYPAGTLRVATASNNLVVSGTGLRVLPGVGQPFLMFNSITGTVFAADFDHASILDANGNRKYVVSNDVATNIAMINDMLANPPVDAITVV